jgi:hypothetical protein
MTLVFSLRLICHHAAPSIYGSMKFPVPQTIKESVYYYRDYLGELSAYEWYPIYATSSIDEQVDYFNLVIRDLFVRHVSLRRGRPRSAVNPWYNAVIEKTFIDRNLAHRYWRSYRTPELWEIYERLRNRVHHLVQLAKRTYMETCLGAGLLSRTLWRNLESVGLHGGDRSSVTESPDRLNSFFKSSSGLHRPPVSPSMGNFRINPGNGLSFANTIMSEVLNSILGIGSDSVGLDEISLKFLKLFIHVLLPFITHIFNTAIAPISILSALSKAL